MSTCTISSVQSFSVSQVGNIGTARREGREFVLTWLDDAGDADELDGWKTFAQVRFPDQIPRLH